MASCLWCHRQLAAGTEHTACFALDSCVSGILMQQSGSAGRPRVWCYQAWLRSFALPHLCDHKCLRESFGTGVIHTLVSLAAVHDRSIQRTLGLSPGPQQLPAANWICASRSVLTTNVPATLVTSWLDLLVVAPHGALCHAPPTDHCIWDWALRPLPS